MSYLFRSISLALGAALLAQAALAQQTPIAPLAPVRAAVAVPRPVVAGQLVPRSNSISICLDCRPSRPPSPPALILLNSRVLIGRRALSQLNPRDIETLQVYKSADKLPGWPAFTSVSGLIDLKLKRNIRVPSIPLSRLKHRLRLAGPAQFEQYGQLLPAARLRITKADSRAVAVRVVAPGDTRIVLPVSEPPPAPPLPPGAEPRIMIRGTARQ